MKKIIFLIGLCASLGQGLADNSTIYSFDPKHIKRDPFQPTKGSFDAQSLLLAYDVTRFQLIAILTGMGSPRAMILLPNNDTEVIKMGDRIGKNNGTVNKITDDEVVVKEAYKDYQGKDRIYFTSLVIAE